MNEQGKFTVNALLGRGGNMPSGFTGSLSLDSNEEMRGGKIKHTVANAPPVTTYKPLSAKPSKREASYKPPTTSSSIGLSKSTGGRIPEVKTSSIEGASKKGFNKQPRASSLNTKEPPKPLSAKRANQNGGSFVSGGLKKGESPNWKVAKSKKSKAGAPYQSVGIGSSLYKGPKSESFIG